MQIRKRAEEEEKKEEEEEEERREKFERLDGARKLGAEKILASVLTHTALFYE